MRLPVGPAATVTLESNSAIYRNELRAAWDQQSPFISAFNVSKHEAGVETKTQFNRRNDEWYPLYSCIRYAGIKSLLYLLTVEIGACHSIHSILNLHKV